MDYKLSFTYEIQGDVDFEDLNQIDQEKVLAEGIRDFENHLSRELPIFYSNDYEFDIKNQKIYIYIYTETELNNDTLDELIFGDKGYWETTSRQTIYYGEVVDNDYYEMPYEDSYEATLSLIISDAKIEELRKSLNEVYPLKGESKSDFINRFMRVTAKEYPDVKQRYAVAYSYWDNRDRKKLKESSNSSETSRTDIFDFIESKVLHESVHNTASKAIALISGSPDYSDIEGKIIFIQGKDLVNVNVNLVNLPQSQFLGFHIHTGNECTGNEKDPFKNAKTHFNPSRKSHPEHAGDLPSLYSANGQIHTTFETDKFTVDDIIDKTIIIHSDRDDFTSQPAGDTGSKIACGVIEKYTLDEAYLDPEEKFWDYRTNEIENEEIFDETRSESGYGQSYIDNLDKEYKGKISHIEYLTPREYFEKCAEGFNNSFENQIRQIRADKETLNHLKEVITKYNKKFPITYLDYSKDDFGQEGRHRMYVAGELIDWDKKFPVLIIKDADKTLNLNIRRNKPSISHRLERYVLEDEAKGAIFYGNSAYDMLIKLQNIEDILDKDTFNFLWNFIYDHKESFK